MLMRPLPRTMDLDSHLSSFHIGSGHFGVEKADNLDLLHAVVVHTFKVRLVPSGSMMSNSA